MITYAADTMSDFEIGTVATHNCNAGFALVGDMTRIVWMMIRQISLEYGVEVLLPVNVTNFLIASSLFIVYFIVKCDFQNN